MRQKRLAVGDEVEGTIVNLGTDAVFVDLDGKREAFIERASLVHSDGTAIEVKLGDKIRARVAEFGKRVGGMRLEPISLRKQTAQQDDDGAQEQVQLLEKSGPSLHTGAHVSGIVVRTETYGVFVQIDGISGNQGRGLVPGVETGCPRGTDYRKKFPLGSKVDVKIINIDDDGKIRLSMRALEADEERATYEKYSSPRASTNEKASSGFGTMAAAFAQSKSLKSSKK